MEVYLDFSYISGSFSWMGRSLFYSGSCGLSNRGLWSGGETMNHILIVFGLIAVPFLCLVLGGYGVFWISKRKKLNLTCKILILIFSPLVCWLEVNYISRLNQPTVYLNYFGDYFMPLVCSMLLFAGVVCACIIGGLQLFRELWEKIKQGKDL